MSVIIRLQNLPWSANALDIRQFFNGLSIPEGGVHIVGGELGDAFIAFSTDEDARQAFNLNGGKIKEVQIKLMLSSRTEMQKVIEAARNPLAAFMQAAAPVVQPLPALIPAAIPAAVPEIKRDDFSKDKEKRERRRSRTRSRDRKERSRDRDRRDRRRRDRSRSRSRDRRDRRRRDRSHSRDRRSKDRDRRSKDRRQSEDKVGSSSNSSTSNIQKDPSKIGIWEDPVVRGVAPPAIQQAQALLSSLMPTNLEEARRNLNALAPTPIPVANRNGFQNQNETFNVNRVRENWNNNGSVVRQGEGRHEFQSRFSRSIPARNDDNKFNANPPRGPINNQPFVENPRMNFNQPRTERRPNRFENSERPSLLDRPNPLDRSNMGERSHNEYSKNSCVQLRPYYGGYGEVRRFFQGLFIHNTGIKFINDDKGKRTGIVYIRFATPDGKEKAMLRNGGLLKNQTVDVKHLDDDLFDKTVDRFQPDFNNEQDRASPERTTYKSKNSPVFSRHLNQFSCLAVEDLPLFTKEQDMLKIFSDYPLLSILLANKQRHITAYIKFNNPEDAKKAQTEKSNHIFDGKQLSIRPCSDEEFAIISHEEPELQEVIEVEDDDDIDYTTSDCVCLSGLPLKTTDRDISDFFSDVAIVPSKIHLVNTNLGFTGVAYCEFSTIADADIALEKNGIPLGSGVVAVDSIPRSEMDSKLGLTSSSISMNRAHNLIRPPFFPRGGYARGGPRGMGLMGHRPPMRRFPPPPPPGDPSDIAPPGHTVRMENVPYKAILDEILEFFEGFDVPADNVLRRYNVNGTPSGEAKVVFKSTEDAFQAVQERHLGKIRDRTIFLHQC